MVLKRKIEKEESKEDLSKHREMIMRGGHVIADNVVEIPPKEKVVWTDILLRISKEMVAQIDEVKIQGSSRNAWIREAIIERLKREKNER